MKRLRLIVQLCGLFLPILAFSQEMVKVNMLALYDKIPAPPADAKTAHARLVCVVENTAQRCDAGKFYQPINSELAALQQRVEKTLAALAQPSVTAMQQIDPQEMQKKLEKMTPEEKIKFAMQMSQQMAGMQNVQPEAEEVQAAIEEVNKVNSRANEDFISPDETAKRLAQIQSDWRRQQEEIKKWQAAEYEKVPEVGMGPGIGMVKEPKAVHALNLNAMAKRLAVENEYLTALQKLWPEELKKRKALYEPVQQALVTVEYGEAAANTTFKQMFVQSQASMLATATNLIHLSREASESAGSLWQEKLRLEKEKP
ncbi:MAG: hypothetical protein ALAOOOJD_03910 [bacterium]|nr:hypothetical protein [bacterium]